MQGNSKLNEIKKSLKEYYENFSEDNDFIGLMVKTILNNNELLKEPDNEHYQTLLEEAKMYYRATHPSHLLAQMPYYNMVSTISNSIGNVTAKDDVVGKYIKMMQLMHSKYLSGKVPTADSHKFLDYYHFFGLDAILGNACCRHYASLLGGTIGKSTDVRRICISSNEDGVADHAILAIFSEEYGKYIFVDPVNLRIYNPNKKLELETEKAGKHYIRANYSVTYFYDFENREEFFKFFENISKSRLTKKELDRIITEIMLKAYFAKGTNKELFEDISKEIEPKREHVKKLINYQ